MAHIFRHRQWASSPLRKTGVAVAAVFFIGLTTGCAGSADGVNDTTTPMAVNTLTNPAINSVTSAPVDLLQPASTTDQADAVSGNESELVPSLTTDFIIENQQVVPTSGWICADSIGQSRTYYFYRVGVLDASRSVAIERTLNPNNTFSDITFFWSVATIDAILMTSVNRDSNGQLISTGQQYEVNSIRFEQIDSVQTFTAESVLRGRLVCASYDFS